MANIWTLHCLEVSIQFTFNLSNAQLYMVNFITTTLLLNGNRLVCNFNHKYSEYYALVDK